MRLASLALVGLGLGLGLALPAAAEGPFRPVEAPAEVAGLAATTVRASAVRPFRFDARLFAIALKDVAFERANEVGTPSTLLELPHPDGCSRPLPRDRVAGDGAGARREVPGDPHVPRRGGRRPDRFRPFRALAARLLGDGPLGFRGLVRRAVVAGEPGLRRLVPSSRRPPRPPEPVRVPGTGRARRGRGARFRSEGRDLGPAPYARSPPSARRSGPTGSRSRRPASTPSRCAARSPTKPCVAAELVVAMNRVNGIYEREVAVRMTLVANNDAVIYLDGTTDPYTNTNGGTMLGENQTNLDARHRERELRHRPRLLDRRRRHRRPRGRLQRRAARRGASPGAPNPTGDAF